MPEAYYRIIKDLNLKATPKRLTLLDILAREGTYLSPEEIWVRMKRRFKKIGLPTVYRNLEELARKKILSEIIHPNRQLYYFFCQNPSHHHHFICTSCRKVEDVQVCVAREIEAEVAGKLKGRVVSHILQVDGLCRRCAGQKA